MLISLILISVLTLAHARAPACMIKDIQCGVCCCVQTNRDEYSAFCSDRELTTLPSLGWVGARVRTLALQRNKFTSLSTLDIIAHYPRLKLINLSRQEDARSVTLVGRPLDGTVRILGKIFINEVMTRI